MQSMLRIVFFIGVGTLHAVAVGVLTPAAVLAQLSASRIISIDGATTQQQVVGKEGQMVKVSIPSQSASDIQTDRFAASGQGMRAVAATVEAITPQTTTPQTAEVTVVTSRGQVVTMEMPTMDLKGVQRGDQITLQIP